jgi:amino acid transporter
MPEQPPVPAAAADRALVRALGPWARAAGNVNVTIGGGIFRLPAEVASQLGAAAPLAYLVCAVAMGLIVLCFAEAGSRVALTGGPYAYVEVAFGPFVGFLAGVLLWLLGTFAVAAVSTVFRDSFVALAPALDTAVGRTLVLGATFAALSAVNVLGVRQGTRLNNVATVAKLLPLLLLIVVGAFAIEPANLRIAAAPAPGALAGTSILLIFAFSGIESALVPSGEVRDPVRTVPRAIFAAMVAVTVLYIALQLVVQGVLGSALGAGGAQSAPLAAAATAVLGPWGGRLLLVGAVVSMFGYVSGMTLAVPRALYAFARDGFLPGALASIHPRHRTPHVAIVVQAVAVFALAASGEFGRLAILANVSALLLYLACCVAAWELRRRNVQSGGTPFRVPAAGLVPALAVAVIVWLLTSIGPRDWAAVGGALLVAAAIYAATRGRRAALAAAAAATRA